MITTLGENSVEVVPVKGRITFVHFATNERYEISPETLRSLPTRTRWLLEMAELTLAGMNGIEAAKVFGLQKQT